MFQRKAVKIQCYLVCVKRLAIRRQHDHVLRNCVHELLKLPFRLLPIFDIRPRQVPTYDQSLLIAQRLGANQKPPILSVFSAQTHFRFPWLSTRDSRIALALVSLLVLRMEAFGKRLDQKLIQSQAMIIQGSLICVKTPSTPVKDDDVLRNSVDEPLEFLLRPLPFLEINHSHFLCPGVPGASVLVEAFREERRPRSLHILAPAFWWDFELWGAG